jgi:hypothetical protein
MNDKKKDSHNDDLSLLNVEKKEIIVRKPPNERMISYVLDEDFKEE